MNIGVDVDGVLLDTPSFLQEYGRRFFHRAPVRVDACGIREMYGVNDLQVFFFGLRWFLPFYCRKYPPYPEAAQVYEDLRKEGHDIYQITARSAATSKHFLGYLSRKFLIQWLQINHFFYHVLILCDEADAPMQKLDHCLENNVDVMIDDNPTTAQLLADHGIQVLLYDAPYNQTLQGEGITRVKNWNEIENIINRMENDDE